MKDGRIHGTNRPALTGAVVQLFTLSMISNMLMLTGPLFMLQVYDRVLASRSVQTLVALSILMGVLYGFYGLMDVIRSRMSSRIAAVVDENMGPELFRRTIYLRLLPSGGNRAEPLRDAEAIRQFLSGPGPLSFFDLPWLPLYLGIIFLLHPLLGWVATAGAIILTILLVLNEWGLRKPGQESARTTAQRQRLTENAGLNAESITAMGMMQNIALRWERSSNDALAAQTVSVDRSAVFSAITKSFRFFLQSAVLAVGAYLAIGGEITGGLMIGASIITSRALAPVEQIVGQWRGFVAARQAYARIRKIRQVPFPEPAATRLPVPSKTLSVRNLATGPGGKAALIVSGVSFDLKAGDTLGILGRSGSGKSSLARALVGIWPSLTGEIRFDGATLAQFQEDQISRLVGYLPQRVELFEGGIAENISRFEPEADSEHVIAAAKAADVHELVLSLPDGYDTRIGEGGFDLSAGQRQRIALARALYRDPFVLVLDEPNSNLDAEGEAALTGAIRGAAKRGAIVIVIAHRPSAIAAVDTLMVLNGGRVQAYGLKDEVMAKIIEKPRAPNIHPVRPEVHDVSRAG